MGSAHERSKEVLEHRAGAALQGLTETDAPIVVEFAGSPKSGKTTNIDIVTHFFKRMGFKVWAPTEGASKRTPYHLRRDLVAFNTWSLNYAISELLVAYHNVDRQHLVILDRGPFDSLAWMRVLRDQGKLSTEDYDPIEKFALHPKWSGLVSRIFLFTCGPKVSLKREHETKLTHGPGTAMNEGLLEALMSQYTRLHEEYGADGKIRDFDTSSMTGPLETARPIAEDLVGLFERGAKSG